MFALRGEGSSFIEPSMNMVGRTLTQVVLAFGGAAAAVGSVSSRVAAQAICAATPDSVPRQPLGPVNPGARLRISYGHSFTIGTLISASRDSFTVCTGSAEQTFARSPMPRIEVSGGSHTNTARYSLYGAVGGAVLGAVLGQVASGPKCHSVTTPHCDGVYIHEPAGLIAGSMIFGLLGSGIGAIIGQFHYAERWRSVTNSIP